MHKTLTGLALLLCFHSAAVAADVSTNARHATKGGPVAADITGTYKQPAGDYVDRLEVSRAGKGKIRVHLTAYYEYAWGKDKESNVGDVDDTVSIVGNVAVWQSPFDPTHQAKLTFTFKPGVVVVDQEGTDISLGFGHNVDASGTYRKIAKRISTKENGHKNGK